MCQVEVFTIAMGNS